MPAQQMEWTADMVRALPEDRNRYEVLDGALFVTPSPRLRHQAVLAELFVQLDRYVRDERLGWTLWSPADIEYSPRRLVQPDLFVVPWQDSGRPREWNEVRALLLVVEALSASTARVDRGIKRRIYQEEGVGEYWIVDLDARLIERWRPEDARPEVLVDQLNWQPDPGREPLAIDVQLLFG